MTRWTNATELGRLADLSRERMRQLLTAGDIPEAVRPLVNVEGRPETSWRIPLGAASRWLKDRGIEPPQWVKRPPVRGGWDADVWVGGD